VARSVCVDGLASKANTGWQRVMIYRLWDGMVWGKTGEGGREEAEHRALLAAAAGEREGRRCVAVWLGPPSTFCLRM
jgi:hypothetical protein